MSREHIKAMTLIDPGDSGPESALERLILFDTEGDPILLRSNTDEEKGGGLLSLGRPGTLSVAAGVARLPIPVAAKLVGITASVGGAPASDLIIDINRNNASLFPNQTLRPKIAAGQNQMTEALVDVDLAAGDYLTVDVDQVGGVVGGGITYVGGSNATAPDTHTVRLARPSGSQTGDVHIVFMNNYSGSAPVGGASRTDPPSAVSIPSGWTRIGAVTPALHNSSGVDMDTHAFWRRDDGTGTSWDFATSTPSQNTYPNAKLVTYRGVVASGSPVEVSATSAPGATNQGPSAPTVTTVTAAALLVTAAMFEDGAADLVAPGSMTERLSSNSGMYIADELRPTAGATGTRTPTGTISSYVFPVTWSIALTPAAGTPQPGSDLTVVARYRLV